LTQEADYILDAAEAHATDIDPRLEPDHVANMRTALGLVTGGTSTQKSKAATVGTLTDEQNSDLVALTDLVTRAKESAKRAFAGQDVKLRSEFQVGINSPSDLGSVLSRARIVRDACLNAANAAALGRKGWIAGDTTALSAAIEALDTKDDTQEGGKVDKAAATAARNQAANELYEGLLTIQNAANNQWPVRNGDNTAIRAEFRLGIFPPKQGRKKKDNSTPTPPPA
jgi:hypothetical protein